MTNACGLFCQLFKFYFPSSSLSSPPPSSHTCQHGFDTDPKQVEHGWRSGKCVCVCGGGGGVIWEGGGAVSRFTTGALHNTEKKTSASPSLRRH